MTKARELSKLLSGTLKVGALQAPAGTTAQRPSGQVGQIRYNSTTGKNETYDSGGWGAIATPPLITTVSPSTYNGESGTQFTINGSFFDVGATVKFIDNAGVEYTAASVTRVNAGQLLATTPQDFTVAQEPLKVKVSNPSGLNYTSDAAIDCGGVPTWNTLSGSIGTCYDIMRSGYYVDVSAGDPDVSATISYSILSGALPSGMTLNSSSGRISGTPNAVATDTIFSFTLAATDNAGNATQRSFSITVKAPVIQVFSYTGADQTFTVPSGLTKLKAKLWGAAGGGGYGESHSDLGGPGGFTDVTNCNVTPADTIVVQVGQGGWHTNGSNGPLSSTRPYPWGGRPSPRGSYNTGYGGGRSALFKSNTVSAINCLAVAGGGGGAGGKGWSGSWPNNANKGGAGGGTEGRPGWRLDSGSAAINTNTGGTQSGIGTNGWGVSGAGVEAAQFKGGDNANPESTYPGHGGNTGGGGGDGWYGGRASNYAHSGAGGGSGYINATYATGTLNDSGDGGSTEGSGPSNPPGTSDTYYGSSAGVAVNNGTGGNGRIVIIY